MSYSKKTIKKTPIKKPIKKKTIKKKPIKKKSIKKKPIKKKSIKKTSTKKPIKKTSTKKPNKKISIKKPIKKTSTKKPNKKTSTKKPNKKIINGEDFIKQIIDDLNKQVKKIEKLNKNKKSLKNCENFCINDFLVEIEEYKKKMSKEYKIPYKKSDKLQNEIMLNNCKKSFCNKKCIEFDLSNFFGIEELYKNWKKSVKNSFTDQYTDEEIKILKKKYALSGCITIPGYNVLHK